MDYLLIKWIHIVSATILFGTGLGSAFHMYMSNRGGSVEAIYSATRIVVLADYMFTTPAVIVQLITGVWLVYLLDFSISDFWIAYGLGLYFFAGACWLPVVWIQIRMRDIAGLANEANQALPEEYWRLNFYWMLLGSLAFPAVLIIFYLMVFKPVESPF